jgi:S-adenosylmethionine decarboxylase|tara:strand:- start:134 stop:508 length:375 start_codon:yes stop_codon:yes gene_type:complete
MEYSQKFGVHLIIELYGCDVGDLMNLNKVYDILRVLPSSMGMNTITLPYVVKWLDKDTKLEGVSGFTMIAESHISIHTYPEKRGLFADVFSCRNFHIKRCLDKFMKTFKAVNYDKKVIKRGLNA